MSDNVPFKSAGGVFIAKGSSNGVVIISSGGSGLLTTISPPAGERVLLTSVVVINTSEETNMEIARAGSPIITGTLRNAADLAGYFCISNTGSGSDSGLDNAAGTYPPQLGAPDESFTITKTSGSTTNNILISYMTGVIA